MSNRDGTIVAEIFHRKDRGFGLFFRLLFGGFPYKGVHLTTEFSDGSILYTVPGKKKKKSMPLPPGVIKQCVAEKTPVRDMINIHKDKIKEILLQNPDRNRLPMHTLQQWVESLYRVKSYAEAGKTNSREDFN
ncbi:MAG: hypothetical protein ACYSRR_08370 [Planctomycetota bacterium]|jgi:hypothetical protein